MSTKTLARKHCQASALQEPSRILPRIDLYERKDSYLLLADLPGVAEEQIEITLEEDRLKILATPDWTEPEGYEAVSLRPRVEYERAFKLSGKIDRSGIEARFELGQLSLLLPKSGPARAKKIAIKSD